MLFHVGFSLCWHFLFFSAVLPLASIYFILIRTCLPSHSTPRKGGWNCGKEKEEKGWGWGDVCYKVPPRVEHSHLSWGWKLKKRLVNLYSWSPRDRGKTQPGKTPPGERHKHTLTNTKTHTHTPTCTDAPCSPGSRINSSQTRYIPVMENSHCLCGPFPPPASLSGPHPATVINHLVLMSY